MNCNEVRKVIEYISDYYYILRKGSTVKKLECTKRKNLSKRVYDVIKKDLEGQND